MKEEQLWEDLLDADLVGLWGEQLVNEPDPKERAKVATMIADSPNKDAVAALLLLLAEFMSPCFPDGNLVGVNTAE